MMQAVVVVLVSFSLLSDGCCWQFGARHPGDKQVAARIEQEVEGLAWEEFSMSHSGPSPARGNAAALLKTGTVSTDALVRVLQDPDRGLAAHVVLAYIWNCSHSYSEQVRLDRSGKVVGYTRQFDGLAWVDDQGKGAAIEQLELRNNAQRWRKRLGSQ